MKTLMRPLLLGLALGTTLAAMVCSAAWAQTYPNKPITLVVPYPPGGATDAISRIIQDSMSQSLGQQIVIENIGGAGGMIAAARAARATPDGYTILIHQVALAAGMTMYKNYRSTPKRISSPSASSTPQLRHGRAVRRCRRTTSPSW